jgi:fatty-acyl-CoA synthase
MWCEAISLGDAAERPDGPALVMPGERRTYRQLGERASGVARSLAALGVRPGDRVGVLVPNGFDCLRALFGVSLAGATIVPINARFKPPEIRHIVVDSGAAAIITSDQMDDHANLTEMLTAALDGLDDPPQVVLLGTKEVPGIVGQEAFDGLGDHVGPDELTRRRAGVSLRDPAMLLYTSGTTADPRGCRISHEALVRAWGGVADAMRFTHEDAVWNPCPMFHIAAIGVSISCVLAASANVTTRYFAPDESVELLARERPSIWYPAYDRIMLGVVNHPRWAEVDVSGLKCVLAVGAPDTLRRLQDAVPHATLVSTFGMTESCGCAVIHDLDDPLEVRCSTSGGPLPGLEVRVDAVGEIQLRGPLLFDGYHGDPGKTASSYTADGWFRTGDLGVLDDRGRLAFRGRLKDMLRVGGENVAPAQIEACLMAHPAVQMAAVVGMPDDHLAEVPAAFVELRPGMTATEEELIEHCRAALARFKVPRQVSFVDEWPMSATKIQKFKLRERLTAAR